MDSHGQQQQQKPKPQESVTENLKTIDEWLDQRNKKPEKISAGLRTAKNILFTSTPLILAGFFSYMSWEDSSSNNNDQECSCLPKRRVN